MLETEERKKWLSELVVGSEICVESYGTMGRFYNITKIDKITPTRQFRVGSYLFNAAGERKEGWSYFTMIPTTPEIKQEISDKRCRNIVKTTDFDTLSIEKIRKIREILKE